MLALVFAGCAMFGALDQYVGSLTRFWGSAWQVGALSAPWLVLPFLVGWTQRRPARAAVAGAAGTMMALAAYGAMTVSPIENASFTVDTYTAFVRSNLLWFAGAVLTGPLFGWLGHRWCVARAPYAAAVASAALMLEPLAHQYTAAQSVPLGAVTAAETVIGVLIGAWFSWQHVRARRTGRGGSA